jgi:RNA polymerase primary sigma factor
VETDEGGQLSSVESRAAGGCRVSDVLALYRHESGEYPLLTSEQEIDYSRRYREEHDLGARDALIEHNLRLVMSIAWHFLWSGLPYADLVQYGNQGLMRAATKYDHRKSFRFSTYATWWIRHMIYHGIEGSAYVIHYPAYMHRKMKRLRDAIADIAGDSEDIPSPERIAQEMGIPVPSVKRLLETWKLWRLDSLDEEVPGPKNDAKSSTLGELTADPNAPDPMWSIAAREELVVVVRTVVEIVEAIPGQFVSEGKRNQAIFQARFGINETREGRTLRDIALQFGMTFERVRQIVADIWKRQPPSRNGFSNESFESLLDRMGSLEVETGITVTFQE